jgi:hypothetical protein
MPTESPAQRNLTNEIEDRCDAIEECYEFMLAFAGKGLPGDEGGQMRYHLQRAVRALHGIAKSFADVIENQRLEPVVKYQAFLNVLKRDAADSLAALELVLAQQTISSQLIDNLNASLHLRALLTDIFLMDGILTDRLKSASVTSE